MENNNTQTQPEVETRAQHLAWCKRRAIAYCDQGDPTQAMLSFMGDMQKHSETQNHVALGLMLLMSMQGRLSSGYEMRKFIEGFN